MFKACFILYSGQGETVVSILVEFHRFWSYENRESMIADATNVEEAQQL